MTSKKASFLPFLRDLCDKRAVWSRLWGSLVRLEGEFGHENREFGHIIFGLKKLPASMASGTPYGTDSERCRVLPLIAIAGVIYPLRRC